VNDGTRVVHAGLPAPAQGEPFLPGPVLASPFHLIGEPADAPYGYNREDNPTWRRYEAALGDLEGAEAVLFASGMAAVAAVVLELGPGEVLVAPDDGYPGIRALARDHLARNGVDVRLVHTDETAIRDALDGATLVWIETPSNPGLDVIDIAALAEDVHAAGGRLAVDNTIATALGQRPLDLGADVVMTSCSKALTGHSDINLGVITTRDAEQAEALRTWRSHSGAIAGPFEAWLAHRSLATLEVRLERSQANALALADLLRGRDEVADVRYPGVGPVVSFTLPDAARAQAFLAAATLVLEATSFGGVHTTAERRARWEMDAVSEGFIRFSAGIEATEDLVADVARALDATR
jgi:cystathionine gamma-lyase